MRVTNTIHSNSRTRELLNKARGTGTRKPGSRYISREWDHANQRWKYEYDRKKPERPSHKQDDPQPRPVFGQQLVVPHNRKPIAPASDLQQDMFAPAPQVNKETPTAPQHPMVPQKTQTDHHQEMAQIRANHPLITRWMEGKLPEDIDRIAQDLIKEDPKRSTAYARAVAGAKLVMEWSEERDRLEETVDQAARKHQLSRTLEDFYEEVFNAEETPSPKGGSGYVNDVIDLSGNRAIWLDVETLRSGRMP
jgi:hypothetical protein